MHTRPLWGRLPGRAEHCQRMGEPAPLPHISRVLICIAALLAGGPETILAAEAGKATLPEKPRPSPPPRVAPLVPEKAAGGALPKPGGLQPPSSPAASKSEARPAPASPEGKKAQPQAPAKPEDAAKKSEPPPSQAAVPYGPPVPDKWPEDTIKEANAKCVETLRALTLQFEPLAPIRDGACGTPAPIKLKSITADPKVEIRPAATLTCPMAAALELWLRTVVQPRAKELLHAAVVHIHNAASYDCRHRNNNPFQRISFHAYAEAIDIAGFTTAKGERIDVLQHWPLDDPRGRFLRDIHQGACRIFGTVLGPEADEAHKNHFHFDLASRRKPLCDRYDGPQAKTAIQPGPPPVQKTGTPATGSQPKDSQPKDSQQKK